MLVWSNVLKSKFLNISSMLSSFEGLKSIWNCLFYFCQLSGKEGSVHKLNLSLTIGKKVKQGCLRCSTYLPQASTQLSWIFLWGKKTKSMIITLNYHHLWYWWLITCKNTYEFSVEIILSFIKNQESIILLSSIREG